VSLLQPALIADPFFPLVKEHVIAQTGLSYYADKDGDLARYLAPHLARRGLSDCASYLGLLRDPAGGAAELDDLIKDLTIGETFFFRHVELFEALRSIVLPDLIARNRSQRRLRIWSAGCATGAEPYSLAIILRRDLAHSLAGWDVSIVGTDINRGFLAAASEGVFEEWAFRATPDEVRRDCFTKVGRKWALQPQFKEGVSYQYHNLVTHPFPSLINNLFAFDLILCRNVMIYFNEELMRRVLSGFHQSLVEGGWLLVGHAEPNVQLFQAFRAVNAPGGPVFYQKGTDTKPSSVTPYSVPSPEYSAPSIEYSVPSTRRAAPPACPDPVVPHKEPEPDIKLAAVRALADRGSWEEALNGCDRLLETDRLNPAVHFYHGLVLEQIGRHDAAEESLRKAIYLNRRFVLAHYYLGLLQQKGHRADLAAQTFRNVLRLLEQLDAGHVFEDGDGITAAELAKLTRMHVEVLEGA
jgi:chemotaxis protein methyltransferase CheR